ncbi:ribulose-5-phosphate 4-epimerase/fuculose-1-phosphate aldolase [Rhodoligotrophos appendicifer]|uniref:class II aldolase and adducin N-terminal domain-containing protein n=1 Tax=Rhodoligotrophos appendicifer TaxID=987056 RepID=UPI00117D3407|nr:class II aldolase and adducin N-terminal domain-containing protein [Rhodoligotrophos appendicifer]
MSTVTTLKTNRQSESELWQMRVDLAAAFRLAAEMNWHEAIANHFSLAVSPDGKQFLMNPRWRHFSRIKASDLLFLDSDDPETMNRPDAPDPSAWCIHGNLHKSLPHARCILHVHPAYATAISTLADPDIKPIDQNTARFFNRVAIDLDFGGIADDNEEGERLVRALGNASRMMMGNHGVLVVGETVAEAFDDLYYLERACQTLVLAYSTGKPLNVLSNEIAEKTAQGWERYKPSSFAHFEQMKKILDDKDPSYAE